MTITHINVQTVTFYDSNELLACLIVQRQFVDLLMYSFYVKFPFFARLALKTRKINKYAFGITG